MELAKLSLSEGIERCRKFSAPYCVTDGRKFRLKDIDPDDTGEAQNAGTMATYFGDFKLLMQRAKDFGKPVVVMLEADGFAFLEQQSNQNANAYAAVAASGIPELAGLPNTVAGWGMAFLQLRKSTGATNVVLGVHVACSRRAFQSRGATTGSTPTSR